MCAQATRALPAPATVAAAVPAPWRGWAFVPGAPAAVALLIHLACGDRYGVFRDELYFLACGRHLAWGYVDQPPVIADVARVAAELAGTTVMGLRWPAYLAHAATIALTARLAALGSRWLAAGAALAGALALPNLVWQARRGFPVLELLGHMAEKNAEFRWVGWATEVVYEQNPGLAIIWSGPGRPPRSGPAPVP